jgi:hypothetical protein
LTHSVTATDPSDASTENLKFILERIQNPEELDAHPWTKSLLVEDALLREPALDRLSPGRRLLFAIAMRFVDTMPSLPPRRGLRLDTRWGEFGILAARYFAPLKYGATLPTSLRDAWGRIDQAILLFVYGQANGSLSASDVERYRLVGNEPEVAADSTLSDWHRNGLQRLAQAVREHVTRVREAALRKELPVGETDSRFPQRKLIKRVLLASTIALLLLALTLGGLKAYRLYQLAQNLRGDLRNVQTALGSSPGMESAQKVLKQLPLVDRDLAAFQTEIQPFLWMSHMLAWVPDYGGDIAQASDLLDLAHHLIGSVEKGGQGLSPLLDAPSSNGTGLTLADMAGVLSKARPQLLEAQVELQAAQQARARIDVARLSPTVRDLLTGKIDPGMAWMDDGLKFLLSLPSVLGAGSDGPQTYLLVAQNEDELRPTGGFITAVGKLVLSQSHVMDLSFENSGDLDNWSMPYPMAPWQLSQYMNSRVLILRDTNWFPDFPTATLYLKQLYAYTHKDSVDGVIAFDQHFLVLLLQALGPVQVDGVSYPITADNVTAYMRDAKIPPVGRSIPPDWTYKAFVGKLAKAVLDKILSDDPPDWRSLATTALQGLQERHLLLQMNDRDVESILAARDWNGALSLSAGDFLMVVDSNVGFTKTNAVVDTSLSYDVDLIDPAAPRSELLVSHANHASADVPCIQWDENNQITGEDTYPIDRCYWDYMRIYVPEGTRLLDATPQAIPDSWMILNRHVVPRVDTLDERIPGLSSFGTLLVTPGGETVNTSLSFSLPMAAVLTKNPDGSSTYRLHVKKQPGTVAVPFVIRVHLPAGAVLQSPSPDWIVDGRNVLIKGNLNVDQDLEVRFRSP